MKKENAYVGIDVFRFAAALLVVAIHTSPLSSYSELGDVLFTRVFARVAVPFFFMTSGYFLISRYQYRAQKLKAYTKRMLLLYAAAILLYLPVNLYTGHYATHAFFLQLQKDLFWNGTMYHLWYMPACIIGAVLAWYLVKKTGILPALLITGCLYLVGIFGDSYYGFTEQIPFLKNMYGMMFEVSDYTRNGVFFAPVFFVLGGVLADSPQKITLRNSIIGCTVSFVLLMGEGLALHLLGAPRHDSMYLSLLPCMFFLFHALTHWHGQRKKRLGQVSAMVYILHPLVIIAVRGDAKLVHLEWLLVENSLVHYALVVTGSAGASLLMLYLYKRVPFLNRRKAASGTARAWVELNPDHLKHNARVLQRALPRGCRLMAVVKANAYGHHDFEVSTTLERMGITAFAVATIEEGIRLRDYGIRGDILILGYTSPMRARELYKYTLTQSLISHKYALCLSRQGYKINVHLKVDTGMNRLGFDADDIAGISEVFRMDRLHVCGLYTHLCVSESTCPEDTAFTLTQIDRFFRVRDALSEQGIHPETVHVQSSFGFLNYPELSCSFVRAGIALYGALDSTAGSTKLSLPLKPVLSLKSRIVLIRTIKKGETAGYGRAFHAQRDSRIAIVSIGYADGVPRNLSCEKGTVLIGGRVAPIVGVICMDQLSVDVTDIPSAALGSIVTLIGCDGNEMQPASSVAERSGSIPNELLSRMGERPESIYTNTP